MVGRCGTHTSQDSWIWIRTAKTKSIQYLKTRTRKLVERILLVLLIFFSLFISLYIRVNDSISSIYVMIYSLAADSIGCVTMSYNRPSILRWMKMKRVQIQKWWSAKTTKKCFRFPLTLSIIESSRKKRSPILPGWSEEKTNRSSHIRAERK